MKWLIAFVTFLLLSACVPSPSAIVSPTIVTTASQKPASPTALTSTKPPRITPSPRMPATPFVSPSPSLLLPSLKGPLVAFNQTSYSIWLYDLGTQSGRRLTFHGAYPSSVQWSPDGCQLYITLVNHADSLVTIVRTDLRGNVQQTILQMPRSDPGNDDMYRSRWSLSPSRKWVAFIAYSGERYYSGAEFQDIVLAHIDNPAEPVTVTLHRGGLGYAWSPDGSRIAYSDYDDAGVRQLYVSDLNSKGLQVTHFTERSVGDTGEQPGNHIGKPVWSPDGKSIAVHEYVVDAHEVVTGSIRIISVNGGRQIRVAPVNLPDIRWLAWSNNNRTIAFFSPSRQNGSEKDTIYWVNAGNGAVQREFNSSKVPEGWFSSVFSFLDVRLIGITNYLPTTKSYSYDYQTKEFKVIAMPDILENPDYVEEVASPPDFPGEEACRRK
jgi:dipeptidyl aminopeptidase/acylaminoacyl peptidase